MSKLAHTFGLESKLIESLESKEFYGQSILNVMRFDLEKARKATLKGGRYAIGEMYESFAYEYILEFARHYEEVSYVVAKGMDVPEFTRKWALITNQDGLHYDPSGRMLMLGDGLNLGEYDFILFDNYGDIVYCEVSSRRLHFERLKYRFQYKERLLRDLFGCRVNFLYIGPNEVRDHVAVKEILDKTAGHFARLDVPDRGELKGELDKVDNMGNLHREFGLISASSASSNTIIEFGLQQNLLMAV